MSAEQRQSLVAKFAGRYSIEPTKMLDTLKATAFKQSNGQVVSNEQMAALLVVADQYGLNPFTKELFAFPDKQNGIVPVVGVDGWSRIINGHPAMDGIEFVDGPENEAGAPEWIECVIYRKDRAHPVKVRERLKEVRRDTGPWRSHPARMLRHKSLIQCARLAFGFAGIYDEDEAARIIEGQAEVVQSGEAGQKSGIKRPARKAEKPEPSETVQVDTENVDHATGEWVPSPEEEAAIKAREASEAGE